MIKVLSTLGPTSMKKDIVLALAEHGVNLFRINLSHTKFEDLEKIICDLQAWTEVPICLDSEGAQVRNGNMSKGGAYFNKGDIIRLHCKPVEGDAKNISFTPISVFHELEIGDEIQVDFNSVSYKVLSKSSTHLTAEVLEGGFVGSNKGAVVNKILALPPVTQKDEASFKLGLSMGIENFALSFTHRAEDVSAIRKIIGDKNLISKIESIEGILNIKEILPNVDQILIDRGDLSREIPIEKIPFVQRSLISSASAYQTPVFVATNLLESMIDSGVPTRAEANDVASTLLMGASGLVLAAETAIGKHPVEAASMIASIIHQYNYWSPDTTLEDFIGFR